ncbi:redoxin domain-containing protein [Halobacteriales archaeon Cl-PHB]
MIEEGAAAPEFELPAVVGGEFDRVGLGEYLGKDVVVLAFYPADFNPACEDGSTDLDELDLFTMQKDVSILAVSTDSVYSHRAFADEYDLHIPLLSDPGAAVAADYGVARDRVAEAPGAGGYQTNRAVVVIDPDGDVEYAWATDDLEELPPVEAIREAVEGVGGDETARARYRVGHAHYVEGRRAFTSAMHGFKDNEWMMAQGDFTRAKDAFEAAADHFNTARRFAVDDGERTYFERAEAKAEALWQAAEWLTDAASAYASGEGAEGRAMRQDAEKPLETARDIHEPVAPDDFPPEKDPADLDDEEVRFLPEEDDDESAALDVDIDAAADEEGVAAEDTAATADGKSPAAETTAGSSGDRADDAGSEEDEEIDDAELEEITAELEQQTAEAEAAQAAAEAADDESAPEDDANDAAGAEPAGELQFGEADDDRDETDSTVAETGDSAAETDGEGDPDVGEVDDDVSEDDIEFELTDPTDGEGLGELDDEEDEEEDDATAGDPDEELGGEGGSHGVPDSL